MPPLHPLTIFLSHSHCLAHTLELSFSNTPRLPWPHQTLLLTLGSLFVLFFFSHKLRKTWDPRSWWRYSPLPLGLEPSPWIPIPLQKCRIFSQSSIPPASLGFSLISSICPLLELFFPLCLSLLPSKQAYWWGAHFYFSLFTFYSQESHLHCRWWNWWGSRVEKNWQHQARKEKGPRSNFFWLAYFHLPVPLIWKIKSSQTLLVRKFRLSVTPTGKFKKYCLICSNLSSLSFPLLFLFHRLIWFLDGKELHGHPEKCLIRSLKFLCNIASSGPSVCACTPPGMGTSSPYWAAYSIFIQLCKWNCFNS